MIRSKISLGLLLVAALGCQDKSGPGAPRAPAQPPQVPASQPAGAAPAQPAAPGNPTTASPFSGEVRLAEGAEKDARPSDTLFLVVRQATPDGKAGPLLAAQRVQGPVALPYKFELGAKDAMVPGTPFVGPFIVQAHLDHDGDPMTKSDDELYAEFPQPVKGGEQGTVNLVLKKGRPAGP